MTAAQPGDEMFTGRFWKAAGMRAVRTFAQTLLVLVGGDNAQLFTGSLADWLIASAAAGALSVLTSIVTGIPEVANRTET